VSLHSCAPDFWSSIGKELQYLVALTVQVCVSITFLCSGMEYVPKQKTWHG
jgi:hypothetical protein